MDAIRHFGEHALGRSWEDLPAPAVAAAKTFLLDSLGVAIAGSGEPWSGALADCVAGWGAGPEAAVWGQAHRLPAPSAALVNAYQVHCLEFDCVHEAAVVHPMATLLAATLATVERRGPIGGREFLTAVVLGVDVACAIGAAARGPLTFFRPATAGAFGAVAAAGRLAGLDAEALADAFGIVYGQIAGTLQPHTEGSRVLALQMGVNARAALGAVDLAARGLAGPREVLEGRYGYYALFEGGVYDLPPVLADLGRVWQVTRLAHKPFPSGRLTHGAVDGLTRLRARHGFSADEVVAVRAIVPPLVHRLVGRPHRPDVDAAYARLCLPFVAATALVRSTVDVPDFVGARLADPRVHAVARRVEVVADDNPDPSALVPQTIEVTLTGGRQHAIRLDAVLGHPDRPLSRAQHLDKFRRCWTYGARPRAADDGERLIALVDRLDEVDDVRGLVTLLAP